MVDFDLRISLGYEDRDVLGWHTASSAAPNAVDNRDSIKPSSLLHNFNRCLFSCIFSPFVLSLLLNGFFFCICFPTVHFYSRLHSLMRAFAFVIIISPSARLSELKFSVEYSRRINAFKGLSYFYRMLFATQSREREILFQLLLLLVSY